MMRFTSAEIEPGIGLGSLRFGMKQPEIRNLLADNYTEASEEADGDQTIYLPEEEIYLSFYRDNRDVLSAIEVGPSSATRLFESELFGRSSCALLEWLRTKVFFDNARQYFEGDITISELSMTFFFEEDQLINISFGPFVSLEDFILWPSIRDSDRIKST